MWKIDCSPNHRSRSPPPFPSVFSGLFMGKMCEMNPQRQGSILHCKPDLNYLELNAGGYKSIILCLLNAVSRLLLNPTVSVFCIGSFLGTEILQLTTFQRIRLKIILESSSKAKMFETILHTASKLYTKRVGQKRPKEMLEHWVTIQYGSIMYRSRCDY